MKKSIKNYKLKNIIGDIVELLKVSKYNYNKNIPGHSDKRQRLSIYGPN